MPFEPIINSVETCLPPAALTKYHSATRPATHRPTVIAAATRKRRRWTITPRLSTIAGTCPEEEEEDNYADDAGSQVTFDKERL
jgi:hypothetical protein